jgi:hypothetical protein
MCMTESKMSPAGGATENTTSIETSVQNDDSPKFHEPPMQHANLFLIILRECLTQARDCKHLNTILC